MRGRAQSLRLCTFSLFDAAEYRMEPLTESDQPSPITSPAVAGNVARVIREWITEGRYPAGAMLPSQRDLAEQLRVSRTSLREALSTLQGLGMVISHPGKGMYVAEAQEIVKPAAHWQFADSHALTDVYQLRFALEAFSARLAALVVEPVDLQTLQANLQQLEQKIASGDFVQAGRLDFEFHLHIVTMAGNQSIAEVLRGSADVMQESQRLPFYKRSARHATCEEHSAIIEGLASGRPELAQQAMGAHIVQAAQRAGVHFPTGV